MYGSSVKYIYVILLYIGGIITIMKKLNLDDYITIKKFNEISLKEKITIVNEMLTVYDIKIINQHLGLDLTYLFWAFNYKLENNKFVLRS